MPQANVVKIVQHLSELPDLSQYPVVSIDTETSGLSVYHGHRLSSIAISPMLASANPPVPEGMKRQGYFIPVRHIEGLSAFSKLSSAALPVAQFLEISDDNRYFVSDENLRLDPESTPPGAYVNLDPEAVFAWLRPYASDPTRRWIAHNAIFDLGVFRAENIEFAGRVYDTAIFAHLIDSDRRRSGYALDALIKAYNLPYDLRYYELLKEYLRKTQTHSGNEELDSAEHDYSRVPIDLMAYYASDDVFAAGELFETLRKHKLLSKAPNNFGNPSYTQAELFVSDQDLMRVLFEMNWSGIRIDRAKILEAKEDAENYIEYVWRQMIAVSGGKEFNAASPKQTEAALIRAGGEVLYWTKKKDEQGKQKADKFTDDKAQSSGRSCWNSAALLLYLKAHKEHPESGPYKFLTAYRTCRQLQRVVTGYLDAYLRLADKDDIIHGHFDPTGTRTGRLCSWQPNLQNVTKPEGNADSKAWEKAVAAEAKAATEDADDFEREGDDDSLDVFVPLGRGQDFLHADFYKSGILLPEYAKTPPEPLAKRIRSFFIARPGQVIVSLDYASIEYRCGAYLSQDQDLIQAFVKNPDLDFHQFCADIAGVSRSEAKTVNFAILYGCGLASLALILRVTEYEARRILTRITSAVPGMKAAFNWAKDLGRSGYVQNPYGRVVRVPDNKIFASLNYIDQGLCGEIMRRALIRVYQLIKTRTWPITMSLSVHDELVFSMPRDLVSEAVPIISKVMCDVPEVAPVPITVSAEVGDNWADLVPLKDWLKQKAA